MPRKPHYDWSWTKLSLKVRAEEPFCYYPGCGRPSTSADHIVPVLEAPHLRLVRSNVRGSCTTHNEGRVTGRRERKARILNSPATVREW